MKKKWRIQPVEPQEVDDLQSQLGISRSLCEILVRRDICTFDDAKKFFRPQVNDLHDPFLMKDMEKAVDRLSSARLSGEKICLYGDYDVDGTTSVSLLYDFLKKYLISASRLCYYLPDRNTEGYGLSEQGIRYADSEGCQLLILADCGIKDTEKIKWAQERGIDVIVIDHHIPGNEVPQAYAILNPRQEGCSYPYKELSACGLVYKFISAIADRFSVTYDEPGQYLDWVTLSIASDIVPITGENRILAFHGLDKINNAPSQVLRIFKDKLLLQEKCLSVSDLVFKIGPKINAAGRMTHASEVVKLFTSSDPCVQEEQFAKLFHDNAERQAIDKSMTEEIFELLDRSLDRQQKSIVVFNPSWHKGILGIVASRIVERYYKPTIVLTRSNGLAVGSARSVHGFDLYESLYRCKDTLMQFGGHAFAAGMTLSEDSLSGFKDAFEMSVREYIDEDSLVPVIDIDAEIVLDDIRDKYVSILQQFEPCGPQNHMPVFLIKNLYDSGFSKTIKDIHAQLFLTHFPDNPGRTRLRGIAFNQAEWIAYLKKKQAIDVVCHIEKESWKGVEYVNLRVLDIRKSE